MSHQRIVELANLLGMFASTIGIIGAMVLAGNGERVQRTSKANLSSGRMAVTHTQSLGIQRDLAMAQMRLVSVNR